MNTTRVHEIFLLGFQNLHSFRIPLFLLIFIIYILTVCENVLIIVLVSTNQKLQSPMYFFLQQLSISDLLHSTNIVPILLQTILNNGTTISLAGCMFQFSIFGGSEMMQCLYLAVMSFDRYLAICNPLRYTTIINHKVCVILTLLSWLLGHMSTLSAVSIISTLRFCEQNTINHFFCDFFPLLELSCSDTFFIYIYSTSLSIPLVFFPFILVILSYVYIVSSVLKIVSSAGRQKAFSTCSSHLAVVSIFYGTLTGIYVVPKSSQSQDLNKVLSLLYTVVIPLLNPIIYSLKSKEMKESFKMLFKGALTCIKF